MVAPFKVGPDFIDPGHHALVSSKTSYNLDSWMLPKAYNQRLFNEKSRGADIAVVEGVMGLFDGFDGNSEAGSTAQMAKWLGLPVLLVISARGKARSAAAIVKGFEDFDKDLKIAGVLFSKTGSERHYQYLKQAVEEHCQTRCVGHMPRNDAVAMPERHLGLVTAQEAGLSKETLAQLSAMVKDHVDLPGLIKHLAPVQKSDLSLSLQEDFPRNGGTGKDGPIIAVAKDKAFCFYYPDNLEILERFNARLVEFSLLDDEALPENIDGIYLGGGYPEVHAETLVRQKKLLDQIRAHSRSGMPIYGECGGFMVLCESLCSPGSQNRNSQKRYAMAGCFDLRVTMSDRLRSLGYREIQLTKDTIIGKKGDVLRGHEFHYSSVEKTDTRADNVYQVSSRAGQDIQLKGYQTANTLGSYLHLHFGSNPSCAARFVKTCADFKDAKNSHGRKTP